MNRIDVSQSDVLESVLRHNRSVFGLEESHVFLAMDPLSAKIPRGGDFWLTLSPGDGTFDESLMVSGIVEQCTEDLTFTVSGHLRLHLDKTDDDTQLMLHRTRGLMEIKRKILQANSGVDLLVNGLEFQRELTTPRHSSSPMVVSPIGSDGEPENLQIGVIGVTFGLVFDWDLQG